MGLKTIMFTTGILADIWNVVDFGIEESLDLIQSVGAQSISLRVTSSRVSQLRAGEIDGPRIFRSDGGYFFQPDKAKYANTRIKPVVASWLKSRDPLEKITEFCKKRDLELRLRISTLEFPVLASRYPEGACKSIYGDISPDYLSASNSDVVELLRATANDLSNRCDPTGIELEGARFNSGALNIEEFEFDGGNGFYDLMALSFDESAKQSAIARSIDIDALTRWVSVTLDDVFVKGNDMGAMMSHLIEDSPLLGGYVESQEDEMTKVVTQVANAAGCPISIVLERDPWWGFYPQLDCAALAHEGGVIAISYVSFEEDEFRLREPDGTEDVQPAHLVRQFGTVQDTPERIISDTKRYADAGVGGVILSTFGLVLPPYYETIRKAFRFASRSSH